MTALRFYGPPPPDMLEQDLPGKLIVIEGTDGVGRSTQVALLKEWLEGEGYAVADTGLVRSELAARDIRRAQQGHTLDDLTLNLFYATDFVFRLEHDIVPALRAGMVVLTDRYTYSPIARAIVRGVDRDWIKAVYSFAIVPDLVIYLDIDVDTLTPRVLTSKGFDYWESGLDFMGGKDVHDAFQRYQEGLLEAFRELASEYMSDTVDARASVADVFGTLRDRVMACVSDMKETARR